MLFIHTYSPYIYMLAYAHDVNLMKIISQIRKRSKAKPWPKGCYIVCTNLKILGFWNFCRLKYLYLWICHLITFCLLNRKKSSEPFQRACGISMWNWLLKCLFIYSSFGITFGRTLITGWVNRFRQSARIHITLRYTYKNTYTYTHLTTTEWRWHQCESGIFFTNCSFSFRFYKNVFPHLYTYDSFGIKHNILKWTDVRWEISSWKKEIERNKKKT